MEFKSVTPEDGDRIASLQLREADIREIQTRYNVDDPMSAVMNTMWGSTEWTEGAFNGGRCIALYGLSRCSEHNIGIPWCVCSDEAVQRFPLLLTKWSFKVVESMHRDFQVLANYVDSRNRTHVNWLDMLGFRFHSPLDQIINNVKFKYFYKRKEA